MVADMLRRAFSFLSSLRLTVVLLAMSIALVFFGTLGQVSDGLYEAQTRYFKSWVTTWQPSAGSWFHLPLPGGYLLGTSLLVNLLAAHWKRFKFTWKKSGILLTHVGVILLLVGQLATDMFAVESYLRLTEGETKQYSESHRENEFVVIDVTDPTQDRVFSFPESMVARSGELAHPEIPFRIRIKQYAVNSDLKPRGPRSGGEPQAPSGIATRFTFTPEATTATMDERNVPFALIEVTETGTNGVAQPWVVTPYASDEALRIAIERQFARKLGPEMAASLGSTLAQPQEFTAKGRTYQIALRPTRYYTPYALSLLSFKHDKYIGTDKPKDFRSRVRLTDAAAGGPREIDIYMNNPLRYAGLTYFQASFDEVDPRARATVLQVVKNPSWLTPYFGCVIVGAGMLIQFLIHLVGFIARKSGGSAPGATAALA